MVFFFHSRFAVGGRALCAAVLVGCAGVGSAAAETLEEALAAAYMNNPTLLAARAALRSTDELVPQALSNWRPTISGSGDLGKALILSKSPYFSARQHLDPWSGSLSFEQPLFRGGRTLAETNEAENLVLAERARLMGTEQEVFRNAATAYFHILHDQAVRDLNINNERVLLRQLEAARDQFAVGEVTRTDVSQAEARLARAAAERIRAEGVLESARAVYRNVIGMSPGTLTEPATLANLPETIENAFAIASKENPDIIAAMYSESAARYGVRTATGELLPTVSLKGELSRSREANSKDSRHDRMEISAQLELPLYQAGAVSSRVREAKQTAARRRLEVEEARRNAIEATTRAWEALTSARAQIVSFEKEVQANEIALEGVREEATVGARTVLDILDAEQEMLDSRVALVRAKRDEFVAGFDLTAAIGKLTARDLSLAIGIYDEKKYYDEVRYKFWGFGENND